ncbi:hypothetical protein ABTE06_21455, partial [Acinetobacter baumannii]
MASSSTSRAWTARCRADFSACPPALLSGGRGGLDEDRWHREVLAVFYWGSRSDALDHRTGQLAGLVQVILQLHP